MVYQCSNIIIVLLSEHSLNSQYLLAWLRILARVRFFICSVAFFLPMLHWRSVERCNFDSGLPNLIILILKKKKIEIKLPYKKQSRHGHF